MPRPKRSEFVDLHEAARLLKLSPHTIALYGSLGRLPSEKIGRARLYRRSDLARWDARRRGARTAPHEPISA